ncbi:hypothetical protein [Devosia sp.]|uniref:hypothetical protein n=1 Tax=Devosia sp. TaxID=1871048 RepID=UPI002735B794|nr:hypothetical protein [Devosia sp.]MDP2779751.1 hypothetical protein [Devosia sp.]
MAEIIRVFPKRTSHTPTDAFAFPRGKDHWSDPPMGMLRPPPADVAEVHISCTFTWQIEEAKRLARVWALYYPVVRVGGPAFNSPAEDFVPGRYLRHGHTFTTRGCNSDCPWCLVPEREGGLRLIEDFCGGNKINDNNLLQAPASHRRAVFAMLRQQKRAAVFAGGLSASLITDEIAEELRSLRIEQLFLAADTESALRPLERALKLLAPLGRQKLRCYALLGFSGESFAKAEARLLRIWELGAMPFGILYQPKMLKRIEYGSDWRELQKTWTRPAAMKAHMKEMGVSDAKS